MIENNVINKAGMLMPGHLITKTVDIHHYPEPEKNDEISEITVGDLHGNALNLLHYLLSHSLCELSKENYERIVALYNLPESELTSEPIAEFNHLIADLKVLDHQTLVRLLGDELGDRGKNDYFVLKILEILHKNGLKFEILLSNHGMAFIDAYESFSHSGRLDSNLIVDYQRTSLRNLDSLIQQGIVSYDEVYGIINRHYKPKLKLLAYSLNKDGKEITIYSHAKIDLKVIAALADLFEVVYRDDTHQELALTIQQINLNFAEAVQEEEVHFITSIRDFPWVYSKLSSNPVEFILWNRDHQVLSRPSSHPTYSYCLKFIHGHDPIEESNEHLITLDNMLGKGEDYHQHEARVYVSNDVQILPYQLSRNHDDDLSSESEDSDVFTEESDCESTDESSNPSTQESRQTIPLNSIFYRSNIPSVEDFSEHPELAFEALKF
ncbi:Dot/Icm T4SS effector Wip [Legionella impletisoli]|nr:Dot/Icm T4SS effector Wip [Legionella impletisoli]